MRVGSALGSLRPVSLMVLLVVSTAGCFDGALPPGAVVLCVEDADCPPDLVCNAASHLCTEDIDAPVIVAAALVDPPPLDTYADATGFDVVRASFEASEPLPVSGGTAELGGVVVVCDGDGATRTCALPIPAGFQSEGALDLRLSATDAAGNTGTAVLALTVDLSAPQVVPDSVAIDIETGGVATQDATSSSTITVTFVASEDLGGAPAVHLDVDGLRVPLSVISEQGRRITARYDQALVLAAGTHALRAELVDLYAHVASAELGTVTFVGAGDQCPRPAGVTCSDLDGDGEFALGSCGVGVDEDDRDPTVNTLFPELPGDGRDNDGVGGDAPIDETTGVFVDCVGGNDANDGSRAAPFLTLNAAATAAAPLTQLVYVAECPAVSVLLPPPVRISILGGLSVPAWTRSGRTVITAPAGLGVRFLDGVEIAGDVSVSDGAVVRSEVSSLNIEGGGAVIVASEIDELRAGSGRARVIGSLVGRVVAGFAVTLERTRVTDGVASSGGAITATNSVISSADNAAVSGGNNNPISLFHSTVISTGIAAFAVVDVRGASALTIVGTSIVAAGTGALVDAPSAGTTLVGNNFFGAGPALHIAGTDVAAADVDGCEALGCTGAEGNSGFDPGAGLDYVLTAGSPLRDRGVLATAHGAPPSVLADFDGECRYADVGADVGADELR